MDYLSDYLSVADALTVLDLIAAEFKSDPASTSCFDLRLVARAIELSRQNKPSGGQLVALLIDRKGFSRTMAIASPVPAIHVKNPPTLSESNLMDNLPSPEQPSDVQLIKFLRSGPENHHGFIEYREV